MDKKTFETGLGIRAEVLGQDYVDSTFRSADDFNRPFQEFVTEYCWGAIWNRDGMTRKMRSLIILAVMNLIFGIATTFGAGALRVDNWAHIGGALGGLALTWAIGPIYIVRRHPEQPNALLGEDINPLKNRYWALSAYLVVLLLVLIVARSFA